MPFEVGIDNALIKYFQSEKVGHWSQELGRFRSAGGVSLDKWKEGKITDKPVFQPLLITLSIVLVSRVKVRTILGV